jgi:hypothetical protein
MKKKEPNPRSTSSGKWRELYSRPLLAVLKTELSVNEIREVYSLSFFLATEQNIKHAEDLILRNKYEKLSDLLGTLPRDYDSENYEICDVVYIIAKDYNIALVKDKNDDRQTLELIHLAKVPELNLSSFLSKRLIYPV